VLITPNFTRIEVFGSEDNSWVEMTVDPPGESVFSFQPVVPLSPIAITSAPDSRTASRYPGPGRGFSPGSDPESANLP